MERRATGPRAPGLQSAEQVRQFAQGGGQVVGEVGGQGAPGQLSRGTAGGVHARLLAQAEEVMHGDHGQPGHGGQGQARTKCQAESPGMAALSRGSVQAQVFVHPRRSSIVVSFSNQPRMVLLSWVPV